MEDIKLLKSIPLFKDLTQMELIQVAKEVKNKKLPKGTIVIEEGSEEGSLFILKSGSAKVYRIDQKGRKKILGKFEKGQWFGEVSLIDHLPRSASCILEEDSELLEITKESFHKLMEESLELKAKLQQKLLEDLCKKLRRSNDFLLLTE